MEKFVRLVSFRYKRDRVRHREEVEEEEHPNRKEGDGIGTEVCKSEKWNEQIDPFELVLVVGGRSTLSLFALLCFRLDALVSHHPSLL